MQIGGAPSATDFGAISMYQTISMRAHLFQGGERETAMNWSARFSWLMALRAGREARPARHDDDDIADMGTAFGLDASFDALPPGPAVQAAAANGQPPSLASTLESRLIRRTRL